MDIHSIKRPKGAVAIGEPCLSCGVRCCNRFAVPITGFDLVRIIEKLKCRPSEFAELAPASSIETSPHSLVFLFNKKGELEERLLTLIRLKTNYCVFSRHSHGCAIWGYHPLVCKTYPFGQNPQGKLKYVKNFVCPRKWERGEYDEPGVIAQVERQETEIAEYNKLVRAWNAQKAKKSGELGFWKYIISKSKSHPLMRQSKQN